MTRYDVAVLGAGPAGTVAARVAAAAGARVVVLERARVPRYKTCGGGIVGISADAAGIDLGPLTRDRIDRVTISHNGRLPVTRRGHGRLFGMVMRSELDARLLDAAAAAGAEVRTGHPVTRIDEADGLVTLTVRDADPVTARVVVGADGTAGRAGTYVGVRCDQVDLGLEGEYPVAPAVADDWRGRVLLDWGPVPGSYAWVFPKGDLLTVGVIGPRAAATDLRAYYRATVARAGLDGIAPSTDTGHLTRVRTADSPLRRGRVLVAGDAAGLLEPWTREGISYALRSGRLAGGSAARAALGRPDQAEAALDGYAEQVERVLVPEIDAGRTALAVYRRHPALFHGVLAALPGGFGLFGRLVDGTTTVGRQLRRPGVERVFARLAG